MDVKQKSFTGKLWPLATTQFLGVFNDHAFKMVTILAVTSKSTEYSDDALFLSFLTVIYVLPFLLFPIFAGYVADRFLKKKVMVYAKVAEFLIMMLGAVCLYFFDTWGMWPLIGVMFMMAAQSAFFSPSFNGLLPELFGEKEISHANGTIGLFTFIAVIIGVGGGSILAGIAKGHLVICGIVFSIFSFFGMLAVTKALKGRSADPSVKWTWDFLSKYRDGIKLLLKNKSILFAILGESYFLAIGTAIQALSILFAKHDLNLNHEYEIGLILLIPAIGMGIGSYLAGRLSGKKVELGLVPYGACGLTLFLITTVYAWRMPIVVGGLTIFPWVLTSLLLLGISAGIFVIPLRSYYQQKTDEDTRGSLIANANVICFGMIMFSGILMLYLTAGTEKGANSGFLPGLTDYCLSLQPSNLFLWIAGMTMFVTIFTFLRLPEFALRFTVVTLTHTLYRMKIKGQEKIPDHGPAMLIGNHMTFIDGFLVSSASSRFVRFILYGDFYYHKLIHWFFKWMEYIPVGDSGELKGLKDTIKKSRNSLKKGELLCLFPEGKLTTNGVMDEFKKGVNFMFPQKEDIPIIPFHLGRVWGSVFSYYFGKIKFRIPREFPYPANVTIGDPVPHDTSPFKLRQIISELSAESEMEPRRKEKTLHYQFCKNAKWRPFWKTLYDVESKERKTPLANGISNFYLLLRSYLLSREIRKMTEQHYVGILLPNSANTAMTILAVMMADKIPAVLNFSVADDILDKALKKADIDCILTSSLFLNKAKINRRNEMVFLEEVARKISSGKKIMAMLQALSLPSWLYIRLASPKTFQDVNNEAILLFSSGSTGEPKGVRLSHHNINSDINVLINIMGWDPKKDFIAGNLPLFHSFGMTTSFWIPIMTGTKVVYLPNPLDAAATNQAIAKHKLTILLAIPSLLQSYIRKGSKDQFSSLRLVIVGAEKLRSDIAEKFEALTGRKPIEGYGCTELSPIVSINVPKDIQDLGKEIGKPGSIGVPMPGIAVKIVHPETFAELGPDEEGLMLVKGPNIMLGYLKDPEFTAEVIKDGWYNTGDIAKMDTEGYIFVTGRLSRFSKIAGEMISHEMVEAAINEVIKTEERAIAVVGAPDDKKGEKLIVLYTDMGKSPKEIIEILRKEQTVSNLWIPRQENFIKIEAIPRLGSGKIDLGALKNLMKQLKQN